MQVSDCIGRSVLHGGRHVLQCTEPSTPFHWPSADLPRPSTAGMHSGALRTPQAPPRAPWCPTRRPTRPSARSGEIASPLRSRQRRRAPPPPSRAAASSTLSPTEAAPSSPPRTLPSSPAASCTRACARCELPRSLTISSISHDLPPQSPLMHSLNSSPRARHPVTSLQPSLTLPQPCLSRQASSDLTSALLGPEAGAVVAEGLDTFVAAQVRSPPTSPTISPMSSHELPPISHRHHHRHHHRHRRHHRYHHHRYLP